MPCMARRRRSPPPPQRDRTSRSRPLGHPCGHQRDIASRWAAVASVSTPRTRRCRRRKRFDAPDAEVSETIAGEAACDAEIIDMQPGPTGGHSSRAIPPVLRRKVLHRAGWKCEVPDCRNRLWLDVHHTEPWVECRTHDFGKLLVVCGAHHRAIHNGYLSVSVRPDGCVVVEHADGRKSVGPARTESPSKNN